MTFIGLGKFLALRLERYSNPGFETIIKLELVKELLSAFVKLKKPQTILLAWQL